MIQINQLNKSFYKNKITNHVLHDISINAYSGEVYGFLGHNGAGKTTTMNIISGLAPYDSGDVVLNNIKQNGNHRSVSVGFVPESPAFYQTLTLVEYLTLMAHVSKTATSKTKIEQLCNKVGLLKHKNRKIVQFSRGMKQRAAIAVALINEPSIMLLDEPTSALDPEGRKDVMQIIKELKSEGKTIFLSTHILSDVENLCDRVGVLKEGHLLYEDALIKLKNSYTQSIIDIKWRHEINHTEEKLEEMMTQMQTIGKIEMHPTGIAVHVQNVETGMHDAMKIITQNQISCENIAIRTLGLEDIYMRFERGSNNELA